MTKKFDPWDGMKETMPIHKPGPDMRPRTRIVARSEEEKAARLKKAGAPSLPVLLREQKAAAELASIRAKKGGVGRRILAIDPGTAATGVALLVDGRPELLRVIRSEGRTIQDRIIDMARKVGEFVRYHASVDTVAVEWQMVRPDDKRPNDILHLGMIVGAALANIGPEQKVLTPLPVTWKGSIKADLFTERVKHWFRVGLPEVQGAPPSLHHNAYDALGLAAWAINEKQPWSI